MDDYRLSSTVHLARHHGRRGDPRIETVRSTRRVSRLARPFQPPARVYASNVFALRASTRRRIAQTFASPASLRRPEGDGTRARFNADPHASDRRRYMDKKLRLRLNGNRSVIGTLRGFDQFLNLVLDDATNDTTSEKAPMGMVVVRGNSVVSMEALEHIARVERRGA